MLVKRLAKEFDIVNPPLPGFGGAPDPPSPWDLEDYGEYVDGIVRSENPDIAIGYSFGGAVLLRWKAMTEDDTVKLALVSPAILRQYVGASVSLPAALRRVVPEVLLDAMRLFYLSQIRRNPYYADASPVMRQTYRRIVGRNLSADLSSLPSSVALIYGQGDSATPPNLVADVIAGSRASHELYVIPEGGHNIGVSHVEEVVSIIAAFGGPRG